MTDPEHKDEEGASRSHPQQKDDDETSHPHIQETSDNSSSLSHSPQTKDEDTCLPHPQKTEEDETPLQQTDEYTSHLHPQQVYVKGSGSHSSGYTTPSQADRDLYFVSWAGDLEEVKRLLTTPGVNVNCRVGGGCWTPVMAAAERGHSDVVKFLLSKGADVSLVDGDGDNTLHHACMGGDVEMVKFVLSLTLVDINSRGGWWSKTPVMKAARWGHRDVVELLVSEGADVSLVDEYGYNILHHACMGGDVETVKFVLTLNVVDIDARNNSGLTAADRARLWRRQPVVELLVSRGAQ